MTSFKASELSGLLEFLNHSEMLKNTLRSAWTSTGRKESVAEHTWRLCMMILVFEDHFPEIDVLKLLKICLIHDIGEIIGGDIPAVNQIPGIDKSIQEKKDLLVLLKPLPLRLQNEFVNLWDEYERASSPEAKIAKAFDKLETILQHNQGMNPKDFDYTFNLGYGKEYTELNSLTQTIRQILDHETRKRAKKAGEMQK